MKEIDPKDTSRAKAFDLWMKSPMPMVTLTKTLDITHLCRMSRKKALKLNMLLCWCIGKAASRIPEFYMLPKCGKLFKFDQLAVNVIVNNKDGSISSCDIPFSDSLDHFNKDYLKLTDEATTTNTSSSLDDFMVIGTSAMVQTELDCIVNQYTDLFSNPMVMWGKYNHYWFKKTLPISFQFHHVQMDGRHAVRFLNGLQQAIYEM